MKNITADNGMIIQASNKITLELLITPRWECPTCKSMVLGTTGKKLKCWKCNAEYDKSRFKADGRTLSGVRKILGTYRPADMNKGLV